jgi:hypothetical protein
MIQRVQGDGRERRSVPSCGLRHAGLLPLVWSGKAACHHAWGTSWPGARDGRAARRGTGCPHRGAWWGSRDREPCPDYLGWATGLPCAPCATLMARGDWCAATRVPPVRVQGGRTHVTAGARSGDGASPRPNTTAHTRWPWRAKPAAGGSRLTRVGALPKALPERVSERPTTAQASGCLLTQSPRDFSTRRRGAPWGVRTFRERRDQG